MEWVHRVRLLIRNQIQLIRFVLPELQLIYFFFITHRIEILITIINELCNLPLIGQSCSKQTFARAENWNPN